MPTTTTPDADVLPLRLDLIETLGRWVNDACATEAVDEGLLPLLRRRLDDRADPDALAKVLAARDPRPWAKMRRETRNAYRAQADDVRAWLTGKD
ncbi:hypothetical protein ACFCZ3_20085 [Cellulosimicrobium cellulans]|uniref:hypothetical protein n=1 Tax=Cellulosimicrobium cellulans TaxID=1710 RepID=UPI0035D553E6